MQIFDPLQCTQMDDFGAEESLEKSKKNRISFVE